MTQDSQLSDGRKRIALEVQTYIRQKWGLNVSVTKSSNMVDFIVDMMIEETFKNYEFNFGRRYGKLKIERKRRKLKPDKEYVQYKRNTEDGNFYIYYKVSFKPGPKTKDRLKYINDGISYSHDDASPFDVLKIFDEEDSQ